MSAAPGSPAKRKIVVGITGASGAPYARRLLEALRGRDDVELGVCASRNAAEVWALECGGDLGEGAGGKVWGVGDFKAPFASGSAGVARDGQVVPCSMGTAARIAHGISDTAAHPRRRRDAQGASGPLVVVPRETRPEPRAPGEPPPALARARRGGPPRDAVLLLRSRRRSTPPSTPSSGASSTTSAWSTDLLRRWGSP